MFLESTHARLVGEHKVRASEFTIRGYIVIERVGRRERRALDRRRVFVLLRRGQQRPQSPRSDW